MRTRTLTLTFICLGLMSAGCDEDDQGPILGFLDLAALDPSFETYKGMNSDFVFENGFTGRINASGAIVHSGAVSVHFQDVEQQEIRFPNHLHADKIPLEAGGSYAFRIWVHGIDIGGGAATADVSIQLQPAFYTGDAFVDVAAPAIVNLASFGQWEELGATFIVPEGIDRAYLSVEATAEGALDVDLHLDDVSVERTS